jgi:hypothetical protein
MDHTGGLPLIYETYQINNTLDPGYSRTGTDGIPDITQPNTVYCKYYTAAENEPNSTFYWNLVETGLIEANGDSLD